MRWSPPLHERTSTQPCWNRIHLWKERLVHGVTPMSFVDGYPAQGKPQTSEDKFWSWARWCMPATPTLWWWRQDHCCKFEGSLVYTVSSCPVSATREDHFRKLVGDHQGLENISMLQESCGWIVRGYLVRKGLTPCRKGGCRWYSQVKDLLHCALVSLWGGGDNRGALPPGATVKACDTL